MLTLKQNKLVQRILSHKKVIIFCLIGISLLLSIKSMWFSHKNDISQNARVVEVETTQRKNIQQTTQFIGTIRAQQATMLTTKAKGVLDILIASGTHAKKGDLIAKIRGKDIDANTALSEDSAHIAKVQYERALQLQQKGILSKTNVEEKKTAWIEAQKKVSDAHLQRDQINIEAPFDGIVGLFKIKDGSQVQEGEALVNLYDPSSLMVEFNIPISVVLTIKDHAPITINHKQYQLTYVQRMLDEDTHMCPAYVNIQCDDCIIGTTVDVTVVTAEKVNAIVIPYEALFLREGKSYVYLMKDKKAILTAVSVGIREKESVEISSGIMEGEQVIKRGQARLYAGAPVTTDASTKHSKKRKSKVL